MAPLTILPNQLLQPPSPAVSPHDQQANVQENINSSPVQQSLGSVCPVNTTRYIEGAPSFASLQDKILMDAAVIQWTHRLTTENVRLPLLCFKDLDHLLTDESKGHVLGEGAFGKVYLAWCSKLGTYVAVKIYKRHGQASGHRVKKIFEEALFYREVRHTGAAPQLIGLCALDRQASQFYDYYPIGVVTEFIGDPATFATTDLVNLCDAVYEPDRHPELSISKRQCVSVLIDVIKKLRSIHKLNVIVNDIKLDNILLQRNGSQLTPYFIDFSNSKLGAKRNMRVEMNGRTIDKYLEDHRQIPPEWPLQGRIHRPSDVYALGLLFLQIGGVWDIPHLIQLGTKCRSYQPEDRPSLYQLYTQLTQVFDFLGNQKPRGL